MDEYPNNVPQKKKLKAAIRVAVTFVTPELHVCNCKDWVKIIHSPGNTSFPIFHHERPISNPHEHPYVTRRTNAPPIGNAFAESSHQGETDIVRRQRGMSRQIPPLCSGRNRPIYIHHIRSTTIVLIFP